VSHARPFITFQSLSTFELNDTPSESIILTLSFGIVIISFVIGQNWLALV
jgi:hypothetical protein